jgi:hypothetical protein
VHTVDEQLAEYDAAWKGWLYTQAWIDMLVERVSDRDGFRQVTGMEPVSLVPSDSS